MTQVTGATDTTRMLALMSKMLTGAAFGAAGALLLDDPVLVVLFTICACLLWELANRLRRPR